MEIAVTDITMTLDVPYFKRCPWCGEMTARVFAIDLMDMLGRTLYQSDCTDPTCKNYEKTYTYATHRGGEYEVHAYHYRSDGFARRLAE